MATYGSQSPNYMKTSFRHILPLFAVAFAALLLVGCGSNRKNTAGSRFWQAFNTRYNVYYNGETHYIEMLQKMERDYEDDYSQRVLVHPAEAYANPKAKQPGTDFQRTIDKMQKAISLHSIKKKPKRKPGKSRDAKEKAWLAREEYNPFIHNAWYLMGKAEYMKGDFLSSAATFHYIARHFSWIPWLVQEAQLWEIMSYCAMGWITEADNVIAHLHPEKYTRKSTHKLYNLALANYYVKNKQVPEALPYLEQAAKGAKGPQKVRLNFLLGQLYAEVGEKEKAYKAFHKAGSSSGTTYRTKFNARIKQSAVFAGKNISGEVRALKNMTRFDRNKDYLDQIYYAIGNLYLAHNDTTNAIANYVLAAKKSTRNGIDKAIDQLALGNLYFIRHQYDLAQPCYAEALPIINEDYPDYKMLKRRSDVLDELAVYAQNVALQDSLVRLSAMSDAEREAVIKKIIEDLKKKEKEAEDEARRSEYEAQQGAREQQQSQNAKAPTDYTLNTDKSWYFYNTTTKNAGKTQFQKIWGNRKLEDNWRRRNKNVYVTDDTEPDDNNVAPIDSITGEPIEPGEPGEPGDKKDDDKGKDGKGKVPNEDDPHNVEYYLKQIPKTEEEITTANDIIQEGLYNMGLILKDKLEDMPSAIGEFNRLLQRYPDNIYRLDVYYNMYLAYMRLDDRANAERYRLLILSDFEQSKYGQAMKDPNYLDNLRNMENTQESLYEQAYAAYLDNDNATVHEAYDDMMRRFPLSKIMPKFMFLHALSFLTEKKYDNFKETLRDMLQRYPETDITPTASAIMKQLGQGRKLEGGGTINRRAMVWSTRLSADSSAVATDSLPAFKAPEEAIAKPQVFIFAYPTDSVSSNQLLYDVARHNFSTYLVKDYDLERMTFGNLGLLLVKGFVDYAEVTHYRTTLEGDENLKIPEQVRMVIISEENFNLLLQQGRSLEEYFDYLEQHNEETHTAMEGSDTSP